MIKKLYNLLIFTLLLLAMPAAALPLDHYADSSVLSQGQWVKVGVERPGVHIITNQQLREWGFSSPERVRIYGYGGVRISDVLKAENYIDDLPQVQSEVTPDGVVFYAVGPGKWTVSTGARYHWDTSIYTTEGYYFVTENDSEAREFASNGRPEERADCDTYYERLHYERDLVSPGEAGPLLVGEEFKYTPTRTFDFDLPGRVPSTRVWAEVSFVAKTYGQASSIALKFNDKDLAANASDRISPVSQSTYYHGSEAVARHDVPMDEDFEKLSLQITHKSPVIVQAAWLNYISVNYERRLELPEQGYLDFWLPSMAGTIGGVDADTRLWDVTDPLNITTLNATPLASGRRSWVNDYTGHREYAAWRPGAKMPSPKLVGKVANQNLHALAPADMVIFTHPGWRRQAERIADLHRLSADSLTVHVVDLAQVYNEFASGAADVSGMRKLLKMLYDRGEAEGHPLKYALLMGRMTYDNRQLTSGQKAMDINTIPAWYVPTYRHSLSDNDGFGTDDFVAMLGDGSGNDLGLDDLSIAVGRIPCTSASDADQIIDKLEQYVNKPRASAWKHRMLFLADDEDQGVHMTQTEDMLRYLDRTPQNQHLVQKVYLDAYKKQGGNYPQARQDMFRLLDEGVLWWTFIGHANNHGWTHDGQFTYNDINSLYLRSFPFLYAATCDFLRWDSTTLSGGEILYKERYGGVIGMISATRPVYISDNGLFTNAVGRAIAQRDEQGRFLPAGEIYRRAKNDILSSTGQHRSNSNRLRYVFMGDPAMRLAIPECIVTLDRIGSVEVDGENQPTLAALQRQTIEGSVVTPQGELIDDFNGTVMVEIYDAEHSVTSNGNGEGKQVTFETLGNKIYAGAARVEQGRYKLEVAMPAEISHNFRPAAMSLYAYSDLGTAEAVGLDRRFYVYGVDNTAPVDTEAPSIETFVLNHAGFASGDPVNSSPMAIARISDDVGLNISSAGIGHQMVLTLDGTRTFTDVSSFFTPSTDGTPSGLINYPLEDLTDGMHTLALRVWDTTGNSATASLDFFVNQRLAPEIFRVYTDANPARDKANFYIEHDRPDCMLHVEVTVYSLAGRALWAGTIVGRSDEAVSVPVTWDLTDMGGRRVPRGIYLYRATISTDGEIYQTASQRIAVAGE